MADTADEIKDKADFSDAAKRRMSADRKQTAKIAKPAEAVTDPVAPVGRPAHRAAQVQEKTEAEKMSVPANKEKPAAGSEPDISLVFRDDEDKRYDIDDILADIEKRHH